MKYGYVLVALTLAGCANYAPVPVIDRGAPPRETVANKPAAAVPVAGEGKMYTVKKGDTLYGIALENGQDYKDVATWNNLDNPNHIQVGQQLRVGPPEGEEPVAVTKPVLSAAPVEAQPQGSGANTDTFKREPKGGTVAYSDEALARMREPQAAAKPADKPAEKAAEQPAAANDVKPPPSGDDAIDWAWPAPGKIVQSYSGGGTAKEINRGIDIAGKSGDPVLAAASGTVTYVGSGIPGYGNFAIVRHNATYLSVYANNSRILVKEHQSVVKGQKIAEVAASDGEQAKLHFEIRRLGKPVDPLNYLPAR